MKLPAALALVVLVASPSPAQSVSRSFDGDTPDARIGGAFAPVGDIDGDGSIDLLVGYPEDDSAGPDFGRALVVSGFDGSTIHEFFGDDPGARFGSVVAAAGDTDLDGICDLIVCCPDRKSERGGAWVYSGVDGSVQAIYRGLKPGDRFGESAVGIGDMDGDGASDTVFGVPGVDSLSLGDDRGMVFTYSGITGAFYYYVMPPDQGGAGLRFGTYVDAAGDLNGDGMADFLVGTPNHDADFVFVGFARAYSGPDGAILHDFRGQDMGMAQSDYESYGLAAAGDVNLDGTPDFMVGFRPFGQASFLRLRSGVDGSVLRDFPPSFHNQPIRAINAGDLNGDGVPDQLLDGQVADGLVLFSGADGSELQTLTWSDPSAGFPAHFAALGDLDGDGRDDVGVGVPLDDAGGTDAGTVAVFSGNPCGPAELYCEAAVHSSGPGARIAYGGSSSLAAGDFELRVAGAPTGKFGIFFYGPNAIQAPFGDGFRCVGGSTFRLNPALLTDPAGAAVRPVDLGAPPSPAGLIQAGSRWNFQFWYRDPMGPLGSGFNLSDGLGVTFCD